MGTKKTETIDVMDAIGSNIRVDTYGWEVKRVLPRINEEINEEWISDKTRYACDGLKNQRLDTPYIKINNKLKPSSWDEAFKTISERISKTKSEKIAGFIGDMTNMETTYAAKDFFEKTIKSENLESRYEKLYINTNVRSNYLFNSSIEGIEKSDLIILIGTNPRFEATILNSRIRKNYLKNKTEIISFGDIGDLTYPYQVISNNTDTIKDIIDNKHEISEKIKKSKYPCIIFGQSVLKLKSAPYIFEEFKNYLLENDKISEDWNALNILSKNSSTVGSYDLNVLSKNSSFEILDKLENNSFEILILFGQDNLKFEKKNEFIIYIGSHGDKGASIADVILPGATYTEQDGYFTNLEGKLQKAFKASYPPGEAKEDWQIINELSSFIKRRNLYKDKNQLIDSLINYLNLNNKKEADFKVPDYNFKSEKIFTEEIDYYHSNVIARASKTMSECKNIRMNLPKTGTDN